MEPETGLHDVVAKPFEPLAGLSGCTDMAAYGTSDGVCGEGEADRAHDRQSFAGKAQRASCAVGAIAKI